MPTNSNRQPLKDTNSEKVDSTQRKKGPSKENANPTAGKEASSSDKPSKDGLPAPQVTAQTHDFNPQPSIICFIPQGGDEKEDGELCDSDDKPDQDEQDPSGKHHLLRSQVMAHHKRYSYSPHIAQRRVDGNEQKNYFEV